MKKEICLKEEGKVFKKDKCLAEAWILPSMLLWGRDEQDFALIGMGSLCHGTYHAKKLHPPVPHQDGNV